MAKTHFYEGIDTSKPLHGNDRRANIQSAPIEVQQKVLDIIIEEARKEKFNNHDLAYYIAIAKHESRFNPDAASETSTASGVAQVIDETGKANGINDTNRFDARASIKAGLHYFRKIQSKVRHDYGTLNHETSVMIYYAYHYGEASYWGYSYIEMLKPKKLRNRDLFIPIKEHISTEKYQDCKLVYEQALQIEKILNDTHGITIQLTDVYGNEMKNRQVIAVFKRAKTQPLSNSPIENPTKTSAEDLNHQTSQPKDESSSNTAGITELPPTSSDSATNQAKPIDSASDDASSTDVSLENVEVQPVASESNVDTNATIDNVDTADTAPSTVGDVDAEGRAKDSIEAAPNVEYELEAKVFTTDSNGCIPEIETDQASPVLVMVPRMYHQEYTNAVSTGQIPELEKRHSLPLRDESVFHPSIPTIPPKTQTQVSAGSNRKTNVVQPSASAALNVSHGHQITFDEAVSALKKIGWEHVYVSAFSYVKQLYTRPKIKEAPFNPQPITPGKARVEAIASNLKNADIKKSKVNESVTTAKKVNVKEVNVSGATPWMDIAIAEQKTINTVEVSSNYLNDSSWKQKNSEYKDLEAKLKALLKELKSLQKKNSPQSKEKIRALESEI